MSCEKPNQGMWGAANSMGAPLAVRYTKLAVNQLVKQGMATAFD